MKCEHIWPCKHIFGLINVMKARAILLWTSELRTEPDRTWSCCKNWLIRVIFLIKKLGSGWIWQFFQHDEIVGLHNLSLKSMVTLGYMFYFCQCSMCFGAQLMLQAVLLLLLSHILENPSPSYCIMCMCVCVFMFSLHSEDWKFYTTTWGHFCKVRTFWPVFTTSKVCLKVKIFRHIIVMIKVRVRIPESIVSVISNN